MVVRSPKRTLTVTVLARQPPPRAGASPRRRTCARRGRAGPSWSWRSTAKVSSWPTDFASRLATTGRGSSPRASAASWRPLATPTRPAQGVLGDGGQVPHRHHPEGVQAPGGGRAHPPQGPHRHRVEEGQLLVGQDHHDARARAGALGGEHRLGGPRRQLGQQLGPGHAHGAVEVQVVAHRLADGPGHVGGWAEEAAGPGDVEEGLVEGDALDHRSEAVEHRVEVLAHLRVAGEAARQEDGVRAAAPGLDRRHGRVDAEGARLVGAGGHDARVRRRRPRSPGARPARGRRGPPPAAKKASMSTCITVQASTLRVDGRRSDHGGTASRVSH